MANASEYKNLSVEELTKRAAEAKEELFNLRFQQAAGQLENTARIRTIRRNIARIKTEISAQNALASKNTATK